MHPMLKAVSDTVKEMKAKGASLSQIADFVREIVNGPLLAAAVAATPTPLDDIILAGFKALFPPVAAA
jgi:hypothetical protein